MVRGGKMEAGAGDEMGLMIREKMETDLCTCFTI